MTHYTERPLLSGVSEGKLQETRSAQVSEPFPGPPANACRVSRLPCSWHPEPSCPLQGCDPVQSCPGIWTGRWPPLPPHPSPNQGLFKHAHSDAMAPSPPQPCLFSLKSCQICSERSDLLASGFLVAAVVNRLQQEVPSVQHYFCSVLVNLYDMENMCKCCWLRQIYEVNPWGEHLSSVFCRSFLSEYLCQSSCDQLTITGFNLIQLRVALEL